MANAIQGKARRRLKAAKRALSAFLARDDKAKSPKKTTAIATRALFISDEDTDTLDRANVALQRVTNLLAAEL